MTNLFLMPFTFTSSSPRQGTSLLKNASLFFLIICLSASAFGQEGKLNTKFDKALNFSSEDGNFKIKFGGRLQEHWSMMAQSSTLTDIYGLQKNSSQFRRARFYNTGTLYGFVDFKLEIDFSDGHGDITDGYITIKDLPIVGNFRVGHFKEPFSLDMMNSSNDMTFLERSPITDIKKQRNKGAMFFNTYLKNKGTWSIGLYRNTIGSHASVNEEAYNLTSRVTFLPYRNKEKNHLLHLGAAYSYRNPQGEEYRLSSRPEAAIAPKYLNVGVIPGANYSTMYGGEFALILNSFSTQTEVIVSQVNNPNALLTFGGVSVEAAYFLTGEHKNYSDKVGWFKRLSPNKDWNPKGKNDTQKGFGALELAARYSHVDYSDGIIFGGIMDDLTLGINWYLNPCARISFNYTRAQVQSVGFADIGQIKFQIAY